MKKLLFTIIFLLTLCVNGFGTTYYVSKAGNNTVGTSWATAWSDTTTALDSVESHMGGGDTCFFGAGTWIGRITPNGSGTINDRTCYADSGISLSPIEYTGLSHITGAEAVTNWTVYSGNVYKSYLAYTPIPDYPTMYCASDNDSLLAYVGSIAAVDAAGEYFHDASTDSVYVYCYDGGNPNTHTILIANNYSVVDLKAGNDYVTFIGLEISYGNSVVMRIADLSTNNPDYITVSHCVVHHVNNDGTAQNPALISTRGTPGSDSSTFSHGDTIRACTLYATRNGANWYGHNNGIVFYEAIACVVESCYVYGGGSLGAGIHVKGNNIGGAQPNNVIRYNTVENAGTGICLTSLPIRDSIYGNIIKNGGKSDAWGISIEGLTEDSACRVFNNTIYNIGKPFVLAASGYDGLEGTGDSRHFLKYNITHFGGTEYAIFWGSEDITDTNNFLFDSNYYYQDGRNIQIQRIGAFANWQAAGQDVHSIVTNPGLNSSFEPTNIPRWDTPITYGGRTWYGPGAVQTLWEEDEFDIVHSLSSYYVTDSSVQIIDNYSGITVDSVDTLILYIDTNNAIADWIDTIKISSGFTDPDTLVYATGLTAGETYYCWVAIDSSGVRDTSSSISFTTQSASITHSLTVTDTSISSFKVSNDYSGYGSAVIDTIELIYDDETDIADPLGIIKNGTGITDPDDLEVTGLNDNTWYYFWFVLKLYDTKDTSDIDSIQTLTQEEYNDTSFTRTVEQGSDDAKVYGSNIDITAVDAVIGNTSGGGSCSFAVRFTDIIVPQGAIIDSAYLTLISNATGSTENVDCIISMEDTADASTFSATYSEYSTRHITSATVAWDNVEAWTSGSSYNTPDFKTSFQELVDRLDWEAGNACVVFVRDNSSTTDNFRRIRTYENGSTPKLATLVVGYHIESEEETAHYCNRYKSNNKYGLNRYNRKD